MSSVAFAPALLTSETFEETKAEVAVWALVAAFLGIGVGVVIYICSVCQARSFNSCVRAVQTFWTSGC